MDLTMKAACLLAIGLGAAALPREAQALGDRVIISCRYGNATCLDDFDAFTDVLTDAGAVVEKRSDVPSIVADGDVRLLIVALPMADWDTPTRSLHVPGFLSQGGRLVLLGDAETGEAATNERVRTILDGIPNHDLTLGADSLSPNGSCTDAPATDILGDPLTAGLASWYIGHGNSVGGGDALIRYGSGGGSDVLASVARLPSGGEIILFGDNEGFLSGLFYDECLNNEGIDIGAAHEALWLNLFEDTSSAVDGDGDGYENDVDCNDNSPAVHPGADEECNGIDDNCDGVIDEGCGDDDDTAGDDDDTTAAGDDDDATSGLLGDDDDTTIDDAKACDCGSTAELGPASLLLLVFPFVGLTRRRRALTP